VMMAARLIELHRVLKPTGSLYLHCDPTASHYLKMILDLIFGAGNFQNEIIWKRANAKGNASTRLASNHDIIFCYAKSSNKVLWNPQYTAHDPEYLSKFYRFVEPETGRRYSLDNLANPNKDRPNLTYEFLGVTRVWRWTQERMIEAYRDGLIVHKDGGVPRLKRYLDEQEGNPIGDTWTDILPIQSQSKELLGYPTQKPIALLERIIQASSNPGDIVLDPFCGCGTAVHAAQKLGRVWIGIDITPLATALIKSRLYDAFKIEAKKDYDLIGEPTTLSDAKHLAIQDRYQFQWWALGLIPARPYGGQADSKTGKKGADKGIDGVMTFSDSTQGSDKRIIIQVKSGKVKSSDIRDLHGTVEREKNAVMGIFVTLEPPSRNMELEAMEIGYYHSQGFNRDYPKIQILTIEQLLAGEKVKFPGTDTTLKQAQREQVVVTQRDLLI
jgi:site-specific DNA-methyltransferase (adenine-specific)